MNLDLHSKQRAPDSIAAALGAIQNGQLIRRVEESNSASDSASYVFKHALVQDTAYSSLMRQDRKRLHQLVAEVLERVYPESVSELAPLLAAHYDEAGNLERALYYLEQTAQAASARFANREALGFYARALDIAEELHSDKRDSLYRGRGTIYERIGEIDAACADLEKALRLARAEGDAVAEWQSLLDLGFAWLARDYARAGEYFEKALELARESKDEARIARTLNRVGNWYMNTEQADRALAYHDEALSIFQSLNDQRGIADTQDLLGMSSLIGSNFFQGINHFQQAVELYTALGDRRGIAASTSSLYLHSPSMQSDMLVLPPFFGTPDDLLRQLVPMTHELGWRAEEAFVLWLAGEGFAGIDQYGRALELERQAIALAQEIGHRQWLAGATMMQGAIHTDLLDYANAEPDLEAALELSREIGSLHWMRIAAGFLSTNYVAQGKLDQAQQTLDMLTPESVAPRTLGQRQSWKARVELALVRHNPEHALYALDLMLQYAANLTPGTVIPILWIYRALAFVQLDRAQEAETFALAAHAAVNARYTGRIMWRVEAALARIYRAQGHGADAAHHADAAYRIVEQLALTVDDSDLQRTFVTHARDLIFDEPGV